MPHTECRIKLLADWSSVCDELAVKLGACVINHSSRRDDNRHFDIGQLLLVHDHFETLVFVTKHHKCQEKLGALVVKLELGCADTPVPCSALEVLFCGVLHSPYRRHSDSFPDFHPYDLVNAVISTGAS